MQLSNLPTKINKAFASAVDALKRTIPTASQQATGTPAAASWTDGFPPKTAQLSGGVAPSILDFNGVLNAITTNQVWQCGGGHYPFDATWVSTNGGYPLGALLAKANGTGFWQCTVDNNTTNPDTGGAGWFEWSKANLDILYAAAGSVATLSTSINNVSNSAHGIGQSVVDVTSSRAFGTPFTNTSNRTITCLVSMGHPGPNGNVCVYDITVDGVVIHSTNMGDANGSMFGDTRALFTFPVPAGKICRIDYVAGSTATLYKWVEYR